MMTKIFLCIIIAAVALSFIFIGGNTLKGYRNLKEEEPADVIAQAPLPEAREEKFEEVADVDVPDDSGGVKISPCFEGPGKEFAGLKLENIEKGSLAGRAGLKNGDIIKVVNGQRLTSPQRAIQVFRKLRSQSGVGVVLARGNRSVKLQYKIGGRGK